MEEQRRTKLIGELRKARAELLSIDFTKIIDPYGISLPSDLVSQWVDRWEQTFKRLKTISPESEQIEKAIRTKMNGYEKETDAKILKELRDDFVKLIDAELSRLDKEYVVKSFLEEHITRVKDIKLAELLKEFNATKDTSPNLAAMGFRTIVTLIIQERAKIVKPGSILATKDDLGFEPDIWAAIDAQIFSSAEVKYLKSYLSIQKNIFDNVVHKPGANTLVKKSDLDNAVVLLERLLPSIIN